MGSIDEVKEQVILFDGVCNLCNGSVNFVIDRDPNRKFRYAALQSEFGTQVTSKFRNNSDLDSVVLYQEGKILEKSDAALEIARQLSGGWPTLYIFKIVPSVIRDYVYDWIARNRYRWFGRQDSCRVPTPELKSLFVEA